MGVGTGWLYATPVMAAMAFASQSNAVTAPADHTQRLLPAHANPTLVAPIRRRPSHAGKRSALAVDTSEPELERARERRASHSPRATEGTSGAALLIGLAALAWVRRRAGVSHA